ncbi:MAG: type 1 glutamine amidotransferase [Pseudomonadota bacterium]
MDIVCFQHHDDEHAGYFRTLLARDGHKLETVMLHRGERIPDLDAFDALWVLGGPMDVWQTDQHPWLQPEVDAIKRAVADLGMPFLGLCLGHQLLAVALGGEVAPGTPEIGVLPVELAPAGHADVFTAGSPVRFHALQWHSAEVTVAPERVSVLASSPVCAVQAMQFGDTAFACQFHLEAEDDTVATWAAVPEYRDALHAALGADGAGQLAEACAAHLSDMNHLCEQLYANWIACAERARPRLGAI